MRRRAPRWLLLPALLLPVLVPAATGAPGPSPVDELAGRFAAPPDSARPGVYWYFMDGNQTREGMTADLQAMHEAGLRKALFLEVDIGVPRGPVPFMSEAWQEGFAHAVRTADALGMEILLGTGPGWAGAGGPWIDPARSMQHLCAAAVEVVGPGRFTGTLPLPEPRKPSQFAGLSEALSRERAAWHADVALLAFRTPAAAAPPDLLDVKALYETQPYSIWKHVPRFVPFTAGEPEPPAGAAIDPAAILDLTARLRPDGSLDWEIPAGRWTLMRFAARSTGQTTRPAPAAGHGFEVDKLSAEAFATHFAQFHRKLLERLGPRRPGRGWTGLHLDSWEMSAQNWSPGFRDEFRKRRGYDPQPYFPAYAGLIVGSRQQSERFLWDVRKTVQELMIENHAIAIRRHAHENGLTYSNQPYDMNPAGDIELGSAADIPCCEFWSAGPDTVYSCVEAVSIAHTMGRPIVRAEAFTSPHGSGYRHNPADLKNQTDWALALGINDFIFHTYQHQPLGLDGPKPGMAMGPYGLHWHRNQTFWPMVRPYHDYIARCGEMLRQGVAVADILYLTPEGAPHIFLPPDDAMLGSGPLREKKGYGFDAVSPGILTARARAEDGRIAFPGGTSYRVLVLPLIDTMTPQLLAKIEELVRAGVTVIGRPPRRSPSLSGSPGCDEAVAALAARLWGGRQAPPRPTERRYGKGRVIWGGDVTPEQRASDRALLLRQGRWIWAPEGNPAQSAPAGTTRYFRRSFPLEAGRKVRAAAVQITADNTFELWVNGKPVATGDDFNVVTAIDIRSTLKPGENVLAVAAGNGGSDPNPAGLIALLHLQFADGGDRVLATDETWQAAERAEGAWQRRADGGGGWKTARVLGPASMAPWRLRGEDTADDLYPTYEAVAALLRQWGVPPGFDSTGPVRAHARRTESLDLFFVANREAAPVDATCTFRTDGTAPELWHPVTGERRRLPRFTARGGTLSLPLRFAPTESYFILFHRRGAPAGTRLAGANFPGEKTLARLDGPYEVTFDPAWGGPAQPVRFDTLRLWNTHPDEGIRYYSGEAVYRKTFDRPQVASGARRLFLDLGVLHKLARVRLNGEDLGIVWTPPYRVEVTGKLRPSGNSLEITVVNTWVNRLIGDQQPANKGVRRLQWESGLLGGKSYPAGRYTFTTASDYTAASPLQESGLLGPVRVTQEE